MKLHRWFGGMLIASGVVSIAMNAVECSNAQAQIQWNLNAPPPTSTAQTILTHPPFAPSMPGVVRYNIVCAVNSLMGEYNNPPDGGTTGQFQSFCEMMGQAGGSSVAINNRGVGGLTVAQAIANEATIVDPALSHTTGVLNIAVVEGGINDNDDAGALTALFATYADQLHARGWTRVVVIGPESNAFQDPLSSSFSAGNFYQINTLMDTLVPTHVDLHVSYLGDPILGYVDGGVRTNNCTIGGIPGSQSSYNNGCLYIDTVHKTTNTDTYGGITVMKAISQQSWFQNF